MKMKENLPFTRTSYDLGRVNTQIVTKNTKAIFRVGGIGHEWTIART